MSDRHRRAGAQPEPAYHHSRISRSQHAGRHQRFPHQIETTAQAGESLQLGGEQSCSIHIPQQASPPHSHFPPSAATHRRDMGTLPHPAATKHAFLFHCFFISPFPIWGFSQCSTKRDGHWYSLASNTSHTQPAPPERGLVCYSVLQQLLFHLSLCFATTQLTASFCLVVVLSFLKDAICIFSGYLALLHFSPACFSKGN